MKVLFNFLCTALCLYLGSLGWPGSWMCFVAAGVCLCFFILSILDEVDL